jgi:hypothetical protein
MFVVSPHWHAISFTDIIIIIITITIIIIIIIISLDLVKYSLETISACYLLPLVSCLAYSSTLKVDATSSSETSVNFQRTTRRYIPEERTLQFQIIAVNPTTLRSILYIMHQISV